jgi:hypothetical protein
LRYKNFATNIFYKNIDIVHFEIVIIPYKDDQIQQDGNTGKLQIFKKVKVGFEKYRFNTC